MRKALFIAYYYPPYGGGGVQRTTKYVKYLRQNGWEPVVLTIDEEKIPLRDESLLKDVPEGLEIIRTNIWGLATIERLLRKRADRAEQEVSESEPISDRRKAQEATLRTFARKALKKLLLVGYTLLLYPDDKIGWYPFSLRQAKARMRQGDIGLIYTTSAPFTAHLIGLALKLSTGKPWVMDLRDPWAGNKYLLLSGFRRPLDRLVEGFCIRRADKVITVSEPIRMDLVQRYSRERADKFLVITNGYDEDDFRRGAALHAEAGHSPQNRRLILSYTGSFYNKITPRYFLAALEELLHDGTIATGDVCIHFAGQFGAESLGLITNFRNAYPENIKVSGYVPHVEAAARMLEADVLLLILNPEAEEGVLTGKIFEYLGSGKPVLAMIPEGLAAKLLQQAKAGIIVPPDDLAAIKQALSKYYQQWQSGSLSSTTDPEVARKFSRRQLAGELAQVFDAVVGE